VFNIENIDWFNLRNKLTSPRSIEACRRLGIKMNMLYYMDFNKFKAENPSIINQTKEIQKLRWGHIEEKRLEYIEMVKNEREKIINNEMNENSKELVKNVCKIIKKGKK
jgi:hypothetical protein